MIPWLTHRLQIRGLAVQSSRNTSRADGKVREKIRYELDDIECFSNGLIFGPDGRLRFKSPYKYNTAGGLQEETQTAQDSALLHKNRLRSRFGGKVDRLFDFRCGRQFDRPDVHAVIERFCFTKSAQIMAAQPLMACQQ